MKPGSRRRLDRVLRVREVEEDVARGAWAMAQAAARSSREKVESLVREHVEAEQDLAQRQAAGAAGPAETICAHRVLEHIGSEIQRARRLQVDAERRAEEARQPWEQKRREKRGLELLVERNRARELEEARQAEAIAMDEVAIQRAARTNRDDQSRGEATSTEPTPER